MFVHEATPVSGTDAEAVAAAAAAAEVAATGRGAAAKLMRRQLRLATLTLSPGPGLGLRLGLGLGLGPSWSQRLHRSGDPIATRLVATRCDSLPFVDTLEIPLIRKYLFYFPIYRKITLLLLLLLLFSSLLLLLSLVLFYGNCHCFPLASTSVVLFVLQIVTWTLSSPVREDILVVEEGRDTVYTHTHTCVYLALEKPHRNTNFHLNPNMNTNLKFITGK